MTFNTLQKDCAAEGWESVESLIHDTIRKFKRTHGGDYDDLLDISIYSYIKAFQSFSPDSGRTFASWVRYYVWTDLFNYFLKTLKYKDRNTGILGQASSFDTQNLSFLTDFMDELTDDAKTVAQLALSTPEDLQEMIKQTGGELRRVKDTIYRYLRRLGWGRKRILQSYEQIQKALG